MDEVEVSVRGRECESQWVLARVSLCVIFRVRMPVAAFGRTILLALA